MLDRKKTETIDAMVAGDNETNTKKTRRARRTKAQIEEEKRAAEEIEMAKAMEELRPVSLVTLRSLNKLLDSFAPGCGWDKETIEQGSIHLSRILHRRFENFTETDEAALLLLLGLPLLANADKIREAYYAKKKKKDAAAEQERTISQTENGETSKTKIATTG